MIYGLKWASRISVNTPVTYPLKSLVIVGNGLLSALVPGQQPRLVSEANNFLSHFRHSGLVGFGNRLPVSAETTGRLCNDALALPDNLNNFRLPRGQSFRFAGLCRGAWRFAFGFCGIA